MTRTVIILTFLFIVCTLPNAVKSIQFSKWKKTEEGKLLIALCTAIYSSYQSYSLFILYAFNSQFALELKRVINSIKRYFGFYTKNESLEITTRGVTASTTKY